MIPGGAVWRAEGVTEGVVDGSSRGVSLEGICRPSRGAKLDVTSRFHFDIL